MYTLFIWQQFQHLVEYILNNAYIIDDNKNIIKLIVLSHFNSRQSIISVGLNLDGNKFG